MALLPPEPLTLTGGCFCGSIRYVVRVPALQDRDIIPNVLPTPVSKVDKVETRLPVIDLDHCVTCRRVSGTIIQSWFICPPDWVNWKLTPKAHQTAATSEPELRTRDAEYTVSTTEILMPTTRNSPAYVRESTVTHFQASSKATRTFCSNCGTHLTYASNSHDPMPAFDITVGSFDDRSLDLIRPDRHGWYDDGVDWIKKLVTEGDGGFLIRHPTGSMETSTDE